jgi:hypothetical protein
MVRIRTDNTLRQLRIVGHGITLSDDFELSPRGYYCSVHSAT